MNDDSKPMNGDGWIYSGEKPIEYTESYFNEYVERDRTLMGSRLTAWRTSLVSSMVGSTGIVLDIGIGCGAFIRQFPGMAYGYDVNPVAIEWLKKNNRWLDIYKDKIELDSISMFDTIEHMTVSQLNHVSSIIDIGCLLVVSLPIAESLDPGWLARWRHSKPGEHLWTFTKGGFPGFMRTMGFVMDGEPLNNETIMGRENIFTFTLRKLREN